MTTPVAFFDFDGTLTRGDSLLPFLRMASGTARFLAGMAWLSPVLAGYAAGLIRNDVAKQRVLAHFLGGVEHDAVARLGARFAAERLPEMLNPAGMERFRWHQQQGHVCVLVSASMDVYLEPWARGLGFAHWITSRLEVDARGCITGRLQDGNCFGEEKVRRIRGWLSGKLHGPHYAYGDSRGDVPMLEIVDEGYLLSGGRFVRWSGSQAG